MKYADDNDVVGEIHITPARKLEDLIRLAELCVDLLRQNEEFYAEVSVLCQCLTVLLGFCVVVHLFMFISIYIYSILYTKLDVPAATTKLYTKTTSFLTKFYKHFPWMSVWTSCVAACYYWYSTTIYHISNINWCSSFQKLQKIVNSISHSNKIFPLFLAYYHVKLPTWSTERLSKRNTKNWMYFSNYAFVLPLSCSNQSSIYFFQSNFCIKLNCLFLISCCHQ